MPIDIYHSPKELSDHVPTLYYSKGYFESQQYNQFQAFENNSYFIALDILGRQAISIPRSPFGSIFQKDHSGDLGKFLEEVKAELRSQDVKSITFHHPIDAYADFVGSDLLEHYNSTTLYKDINQVIELSEDWASSIHTMQKRKLKSLKDEGFYFRKMEDNEWETAHKFLTICRQAQGLQINISWEQLNRLVTAFPESYECFGVFRGTKISALCISANVNSEVAYYYLPATSPMFRTHSPMVMLLAGMVEYYQKKGFKFLDLGVSSVEGKPQETLMLFKERMGAISFMKPTLQLLL